MTTAGEGALRQIAQVRFARERESDSSILGVASDGWTCAVLVDGLEG